ncbi:hypothetical protein E2562_031208 [Oryza meyeriana var. granulata]|uniref:DUF6598 domain-containing protein n=1 Tax=Oryza meyeriana var. granulata TaxID=110450 RepID=A0A6G1DQB4_9ORYZ|nr:hypothetical protein E2562_031208 [Oryza meyeriana var. granulata]
MAIDGERDSTIMRAEEEKEEGQNGADNDHGKLEPFFYDEAAATAHDERWAAHKAVIDWISETDPETGTVVYNRYHEEDLSEFEIGEPGEGKLYHGNMVNVLAVRIADDVPFPIAIYNSVIARDDLDRKCLPLFRRCKDDP